MQEFGIKNPSADLSKLGIENVTAHWNLDADTLAEMTIAAKQGEYANNGALAIDTGEFTGRSPMDRFIVKDDVTANSVDWNDINIAFDSDKFDQLYKKITTFLSNKEVYVRDAKAVAHPSHHLNVRVITQFPWQNIFVHNMFLRLSDEEVSVHEPEWTVINAPEFMAEAAVDGTRQHNFAIINFSKKVIIVGGTAYTGEIKKGIFSVLNFVLPHDKNVLSMHCSANVGANDDTAIFFGLSGTGKTTLSADANRKLIGDDEHGWDGNDVFNFEGGCYAKTINLSAEGEPQIFKAIKKGAMLENIVFKQGTKEVDFDDTSKTQNTRVSYPIYHIDNIMEPSIGHNPKNIFFLTCDAFGVLPPISKLSAGQAMYQFISGYTAKVAGTEAGITEPKTVFSACFGAPFLPLHPTKYAEMLGERMKASNVNVWLVNTGWTGGEYGVGNRMKLKYTRAMITAALEGELNNVEYTEHPVFGLQMPNECVNVPTDILHPRNTWSDKDAYDAKANLLAESFVQNFEQYANKANAEIMAAAPKVGVA